MVCTAARGGMRSVVEGYGASGVHARWNVRLVWSHAECGLLHRMLLALQAYAACAWLMLTRRAALVHVHAAMKGSFWRKSVLVVLGRLLRTPVVFHMHGSETVKFIDSLPYWARAIACWVLCAADRVVVLTDRWANYVASIAPAARVTVLGNYVPVPAACPAPRQRAPGEPLRVVFMGAVGQRKGIYPLLDAVARLRQSGVPLELVVGGNGEVDKARAHACGLGLQDAVKFLGWVDAAARDRELDAAHAFVLPSFNEGLPMSLLEAMARALPVVSTRVGGIPDLITHQQDGLLCDAGDVGALAACLQLLAADEAARQRLARAGHARVAAAFSEAHNVPKLEALYRELTASRG